MTVYVNILLLTLWLHHGRWDLTADHRYTLSEETRRVVEQVDAPMTVQVLLDEKGVNAGFQRLRQATDDWLNELQAVNSQIAAVGGDVPTNLGLQPIVVHERTKQGQMVQTPVYPYAVIRYKNRLRVVELLQKNPGRSGEENLNSSIETLEYRLAEAIHGLENVRVDKVAFLEGHGELSEHEVWDWCRQLSNYYQVDRGVMGNVVGVLDGYKAVIVADPREALSETDKYILDQYIMQGGSVMWLLDGVRFSEDMLQTSGLTPVIAEDWGVRDMLFRYGVRINPVLVQDLQCEMVPVEVSGSETESQFQPMPWTYAPLLLTSEASPISKDIAQVKSAMVSEVEAVGEEDGIVKQVLLATSTASRKTGVPSEVNLMDMTVMPELFRDAYIPVAMSLEGSFPSLFAHRMAPEQVIDNRQQITGKKASVRTRQVVVASGRIAVNEWQGNEALPVGYDRYMKTSMGNRDFLVNCVLWLTDDSGLMALRGKRMQLRLLNDKQSYDWREKIQVVSVVGPIVVLALVGLTVVGGRRRKYIVK